MTCHKYDDSIDECLNITIKKPNRLRKYKCDFIIHNKKLSQCIKKGNLKKYKGYELYKNQKFDIKDRENIKIPKINKKQAISDTERYLKQDTLKLMINNKNVDSKKILDDDKIYNLIRGLLSPGFHNDLNISTFKYCDFIKKIFKMKQCPDYIMCNTEIDNILINITDNKQTKKFKIRMILKGNLTCLTSDSTVDRRSVDKTSIDIIWNQKNSENIKIKYNMKFKKNN